MKFSTIVELDVFYTMVTKNFVAFMETHRPKFQIPVIPKLPIELICWNLVLRGRILESEISFYFWELIEFRY